MKGIPAFLFVLSCAVTGWCIYQITQGENLAIWYILAFVNAGNVIVNAIAMSKE